MTEGTATQLNPTQSPPGLPARSLGRYSLLAKLASGGMAEIFLARQQGVQGFEKLVVVKRILASFSEDPEFVTMFLEEGRLAGQLNHPNVVQTFDLGEDHGTYFIAMEYIAGESLAMVARQARVRGRSVDTRIAARLISQAAEGLDYAHRKTDILGKPLHIVHRDISPQNLLVTYEGMAKVVDFGIARASNRASHTAQGQVRGKLSYMSPEQMREGAVVDGRSDLFSLGVVLFEMVTGSRLVEGGDPGRAVAVICGSQPLPTALKRRPDIDPKLDAIISKAMNRDADERYQTGGDLHRALDQWLATAGMVGAAEVSEFMADLFADRLAERQKLIEKALSGELESSGPIAQAEVPSDRSMPDRSNKTILRYAAIVKRWRGIAVACAGLAVIAGMGWLLRDSHSAAPALVPDVSVAARPARPTIQLAPVPLAPAVAAKVEPPPPTPVVVPPPKSVVPPAPPPVAAPARLAVVPVAVPKPAPAVARPQAAIAVAPPRPHPPEKRASPAPTGRMGKLTIDTVPWTEVYWRGKDLGQTPLFEIALPSGSQQLVLKNAGESVDQTIEVEIEAGKVNAQKLHL